MKILMLMFFMFNVLVTQGQVEINKIIKLPDFYKGEGVVLSLESDLRIKMPVNSELYLPTIEEIKQAEKLLVTRYNEDVNWVKDVKNIKRKFWKYNRQYLGYVDNEGNRKVLINLLNFKCKKWEDENYPDWKDHYFVGFGEFYEKNTMRIDVNLTTNRLKLW